MSLMNDRRILAAKVWIVFATGLLILTIQAIVEGMS